ncbi:MAG: type II toxin-antitoxin system VapC family toxin [Steroidobacteraceae bacterium]
MTFWDASAVVPLILDEAGTAPMDASYPTEAINVWWGTLVEVTSAIVRRERAGSLSPDGVTNSLALLSNMASRWNEVPPSGLLRERARRVLRTHGLRAADGLQLAAALTLARDDPGWLDFICRDSRLAEAAAREGLRVRSA